MNHVIQRALWPAGGHNRATQSALHCNIMVISPSAHKQSLQNYKIQNLVGGPAFGDGDSIDGNADYSELLIVGFLLHFKRKFCDSRSRSGVDVTGEHGDGIL